MYDLILFDLDGTLTYPEEGITKSVQYALESFGIYEQDKEKLRRFIGPPLIYGFTTYYGLSYDEGMLAVEKYRERFRIKGIYENSLIDGVDRMLKNLKNNNKKLALATSKPHIFANEILKHFSIDKYFDVVVGAEFDGTRNEKADVISKVLSDVKGYKNPVMVGDRMHDVIGAKTNNIPCIGVSFGYAEKGELEENGADIIADSIATLEKILLK